MYWATRFYPFAKFGRYVYFYGEREKKKIALTFDDGPSKGTNEVLKILRKYKARGTFFILGNKVKSNEKILKDIIKQESEIGNHSYDHPYLSFKSKKFIRKQITKTDDELRKINIETKLFRPPHGNFGFNLLSVIKKADKRVILWDVDPKDWRKPGIKIVVSHILSHVKSGSIIDLHDFLWEDGKNNDLAIILDKVIPYLQNQEYEFVTISELLKL